jgi:serine protease AprX
MATARWEPRDPVGREDEDPTNVIYAARIRNGQAMRVVAEELPEDAFVDSYLEPKDVDEELPVERRDKVHPLLRDWLRDRDPDDREEIIVVAREKISMPRFPEPAIDEQRDGETNRRLLGRARQLVAETERARAESLAELTEAVERFDGNVVERFWIINGVLVDLPLRAVETIAEDDDIVSLEPRFSGEEPPQNEIDDGRAVIVSDPYFHLGQTSGWIGLLDTGVRFTHVLFTNPSHIDFRRDCVNGGADCNTGTGLNPNDTFWNHGTSTAAIITGNNRLANDFRGVTGITLDSFQVYTNTGLDQAAAIRGFQTAVAVLDRVIVAEMQAQADHLSAIAQAADNAFDAGAVVVAANGNFGPGGSTVRCPANAHRVIGVGNVDVQSLSQVASQGRGPTGDSRFKPDIQAPTNTDSASNASDTATQNFSGTSGATPYASGAAALLRNWLRGGSGTIDPGQVYAQMILAGRQPYPFDNTSGAGVLRLPTDGWAWWGKVSVADRATVEISLDVSNRRANTLDAAIWWPEYGFRILWLTLDPHNDVDLDIIDPQGTTRAWSISVNSVYERARVVGSVATGIWKLRISGFHVPFGPQTVYWAAHVRFN